MKVAALACLRRINGLGGYFRRSRRCKSAPQERQRVNCVVGKLAGPRSERQELGKIASVIAPHGHLTRGVALIGVCGGKRNYLRSSQTCLISPPKPSRSGKITDSVTPLSLSSRPIR